MISVFMLQLTSVLSGMLLGIIFSLQMADHHTKVKVENFRYVTARQPKAQSYTNVNQMWVSYSSSTTTGLLFSGNDLVNGAFRGAKSVPPGKASKQVRSRVVT